MLTSTRLSQTSHPPVRTSQPRFKSTERPDYLKNANREEAEHISNHLLADIKARFKVAQDRHTLEKQHLQTTYNEHRWVSSGFLSKACARLKLANLRPPAEIPLKELDPEYSSHHQDTPFVLALKLLEEKGLVKIHYVPDPDRVGGKPRMVPQAVAPTQQ